MRAQLTFILLLSLSGVAGAQHHASPIAGAVPELPPVGLPLPQSACRIHRRGCLR